MKLITISGLDGSGKSTQIQLLTSYLESQGNHVFYFHAIDFSIANSILRKKMDDSGMEDNKIVNVVAKMEPVAVLMYWKLIIFSKKNP